MWRLAAFAALLTTPAGLCAQTADAVGVPSLTVRLYRSSVRPEDSRAARVLTDQILRASGIRVLWLKCCPDSEDPGPVPTACGRPLTPTELVLSIVPTDDSQSPDNRQALGTAVVDVAAGAGTVATIFSEPVAALARDALTSRVDLLGRAMAHEIGHLLIGTNRHTVRGLMRAVFLPDELRQNAPRDWVFSRSEGMAMRHALELRALARPAGQPESGLGRHSNEAHP